MHGVGRHLEQAVGRDALIGVVGERAGHLLGMGEGGKAAVRHGDIQRVLDGLEQAVVPLEQGTAAISIANGLAAERRFADANLAPAGEAANAGIAQEAGRDQPHGAVLYFHRIAADNHLAESLRAGRVSAEAGPGEPRHRAALGSVNNHSCEHRLAAGRRLGPSRSPGAPPASRNTSCGAAKGQFDPAIEQGVFQVFFTWSGGAVAAERLPFSSTGPEHLDLAEQDAVVLRRLFQGESDIARGGLKRRGQNRDTLAAARLPFQLRHLFPGLLVVADRHGHALDVEAAASQGRLVAAVNGDADLVDLLGLAQVGVEGHIAVVLDALLGSISPSAVRQAAGRVGVRVRRAARAGRP